jgi:hypothetical protein
VREADEREGLDGLGNISIIADFLQANRRPVNTCLMDSMHRQCRYASACSRNVSSVLASWIVDLAPQAGDALRTTTSVAPPRSYCGEANYR